MTVLQYFGEEAENWDEAVDEAPIPSSYQQSNQPQPAIEDPWPWFDEADDGSVPIVTGYQQHDQPTIYPEDIQGFDADDLGDDWEIYQTDSAPVRPNAIIPLAALAYEDPWDWFGEADEGATPFITGYQQQDVAQTPVPIVVEDTWWHWEDDHEDELIILDDAIFETTSGPDDAWEHWADEIVDDWDLQETSAPVAPPGGPANCPEDAWDWMAPEDATDELWDDDGSNVGNGNRVLVAALGPEDAWDWWTPEDLADDPPDDDGSNVQNPNFMRFALPEDPWDWTEDTGDDDLTDDGWSVRNNNVATFKALGPEDPWDWTEDTGDDDLTDDGYNVGNTRRATPPPHWVINLAPRNWTILMPPESAATLAARLLTVSV